MQHVINIQRRGLLFITIQIFLMIMCILLIQGCGDDNVYRGDFKTEYQGIVLINGTGYFGKIEKMGGNFLELSDVYYVENQKNSETMQTILIKRGNEVHEPDRMYINIAHIILIEPVAKDSKIAQSINAIKIHK
jgi:hypothetical protein